MGSDALWPHSSPLLGPPCSSTAATSNAAGRRSRRSKRAATSRLHWLAGDLSSLDEVRALADRVTEQCDRLDALVNNAGIGTSLPGDGARLESRDGYELRFAVNYLSGYLLTRMLLALLERSAPARVVNVSSAGQAAIDFDDVMLERHYDGVQADGQSKLAQIMFTLDLAEEFDSSVVSATCLHPATYMPTKMVTAAGIDPTSTLEQGVQATLALVIDPELDGVNGVYFNGRQAAGRPTRRLMTSTRGGGCGS